MGEAKSGLMKAVANEMFHRFPYHKNYMDLTRMELNALAAVNPAGLNFCKFAIIGSGPLPMTSLCISNHLRSHGGCVSCQNLDHNIRAIWSSRNVCRALGHNGMSMSFQCGEAKDTKLDYADFDVVYLTALVGACSEQKRDIMANVVKKMRPGTLVLVRSARKSH